MGHPPSAPLSYNEEDIPVVTATPITSTATSTTPAVGRIVTTTYEDGRQETVTEYQQPGNAGAVSTTANTTNVSEPVSALSALAPAPVTAAARPVMVAAGVLHCEPGVLRSDLGARSVMIMCGHCHHTGKTKLTQQIGSCTFISIILLLFLVFPLFWIPFICPSCKDTEHTCSNCGRVVGKSQAECCS